MASSGSLLNYFKQPKKGLDTAKLPAEIVEECVIIDDDEPTSSKRKGSLTSLSDASGKRRRLSLLNSRPRQSNDNLKLDKNKKRAANGLKLLGKISASRDRCSPPTGEKRENQAHTPSKRNCNKDLEIKIVSKTLKRELKISTEIKEDSLSPIIKRKRGSKKQLCVLSESEEESAEIISETEEESHEIISETEEESAEIISETEEESAEIITENEEESPEIISETESVDKYENKPSIQSTLGHRSTSENYGSVKQKRGSKKQACVPTESEEEPPESEEESAEIISETEDVWPEIITENESDDKSENKKSIQSTPGRRSTRARKPVERYTTVEILDESSNDEKRPRKQKKKVFKENLPPEDDLMIIDNVPKPRRSVSSVLGSKPADKKKPQEQEPPRQSSSSMMAEAKKLMMSVSSSRSSPIPPMQCQSQTVKRVDEVIWPKISHTGQYKDIIIYPQLSKEEPTSTVPELSISDEIFRYRVDSTHLQMENMEESLSYDECVDMMKNNHPNDDVDQIIEMYRNCRRSESKHESPESSKSEVRSWSQIYSPIDHGDILGNKNSAKQLFKWLSNWKTKLLNEKKKKNKKKRYDSYSSEESYVCSGEEEVKWLDNVVLLVGPYGVGKSGAISTCAKQLDYKITELNASSERSGKDVAERFSEASQSHCVTGKSGAADFTTLIADITAKNSTKSKEMKSGLNSFFGRKSEAINVDKPSTSRKKSAENKGKMKLKKIPQESKKITDMEFGSKVEKLSLIVLEEIDIVFEDDRGFLPAIVALTQVAKRPIILTSNNPNICLPTDAEFLVLNFSPPKVENMLLNAGCFSLSYNNYIWPYQLQQFSQFFNNDIRKLFSHLEFLNTSYKTKQLSSIGLSNHFFGSNPSLTSQRTFLQQTQSINLQFLYLNLEKLLGKTPEIDLRKQVVCHDTFLYLDMMTSRSRDHRFMLYPTHEAPLLTELQNEAVEDAMLDVRVAVEGQALNFLNIKSCYHANIRANNFKWKEMKRFSQIKEVQRGISSAVSGFNLLSGCVYEELSAIRQICKSEQIKEASGRKRRFHHYLGKEVDMKHRDMMCSFWLGS